MIILGIETSCDETAISIIETDGKIGKDFQIKVLANEILSQIALHKEYGGVFPMLAKREHSKNLMPLLLKALKESGFLKLKIKSSKSKIEENLSTYELKNLQTLLGREPELLEQFEKEIPKIEKPPLMAIAVTKGPGLEPALWTGINFAKALSAIWNIPLIPINHMEGHIFAGLLQKCEPLITNHQSLVTDVMSYKLSVISFPVIALLVSGGHTELIEMKDWFDYKILGATRDDAVGEAFDKVARILGLPYPGGPEISNLAETARLKELRIMNYELRKESETEKIKLPRPMIHSGDFDFSFSGIKTAVLYLVKKLPELTDEIKAEIAREFEDAVVEVLTEKTRRTISETCAQTLIVGGGVAANKLLRKKLTEMAGEEGADIFISEISHSTDNALMIAVAGATHYANFGKESFDNSNFKATGGLKIDNADLF